MDRNPRAAPDPDPGCRKNAPHPGHRPRHRGSHPGRRLGWRTFAAVASLLIRCAPLAIASPYWCRTQAPQTRCRIRLDGIKAPLRAARGGAGAAGCRPVSDTAPPSSPLVTDCRKNGSAHFQPRARLLAPSVAVHGERARPPIRRRMGAVLWQPLPRRRTKRQCAGICDPARRACRRATDALDRVQEYAGISAELR